MFQPRRRRAVAKAHELQVRVLHSANGPVAPEPFVVFRPQPIRATVVEVLAEASTDLRTAEVRARVEQRLDDPVSWSSVRNALVDLAGRDEGPIERVEYGRYRHRGAAGRWPHGRSPSAQRLGFEGRMSAAATTIDPTVTSLPELRLNAVCPYYTMYPLAFPFGELADARPGEAVLDPFCGRGTTLFAARLRGLDTVGVDLNPVAAAIAEAKLASTTVGRVMALVDELLAAHQDADVPFSRFWTLAFDAQTLREVCALRAGLQFAGQGHTAALLRAVFLGALHGPRNKGIPSYLSNQMPRSYATKPEPAVRFWEKRELLPVRIDTREVIRRRTARVLEAPVPAVAGRVILGDARMALRGTQRRYSRVVTSPPYLGMRTYLPDQWLRHWALGGEPSPAYALPGQIASQRPELFASELADVWTAVGAKCEPGARMTVRFGALPSVPVEPSDVIVASLRKAQAPWRVIEERPAGVPRDGRRQSDQFGRDGSDPITEIDVVAILDA